MGLTAMYKKQIVHRDLKLDNVLISFPNLGADLTQDDLSKIDLEKEDFVVKIADFGFSRELREGKRSNTIVGT